MEYTLFFPTPWDAVNPENDNIDVCMTFSNGQSYTFVLATPENLKRLMAAEGKPYLSPGVPMLIAQKLTEEVVFRMMEELVQDDSLLLRYGSDLYPSNRRLPRQGFALPRNDSG